MLHNVTFSQVDTTDEIAREFNRVIDNVNQMQTKICQLSNAVDASVAKGASKSWVTKLLTPTVKKVTIEKDEKKEKGKSKMKSKGSANIRIVAILVLIAAVGTLCYAQYRPMDINTDIAANHDMLARYLRDVLGTTMASNSYLFNPTTTLNRPPSAEGRIYYDSDTNEWIGYNAAGWTSFAVASGASLNASYGMGATITANSGTVTIQTTEADANPALTVIHSGVDASGHGIFINVSGAAAKEALKITNTGTGYDIEGTAGFTLSKTGQIVGLDLDLTGANGITLQNDETITNAADGKITFTTNGGTANTLIFDLQAGAAAMQLESNNVTEFQFGDVDDLTQVGTIVFDVAAASITLPSTGDAEDLTVQVTGATNSSLILTAAGTNVDALQISATNAGGGIDIDAYNDISITVTSDAGGEDLLLTQTGGQAAGIILTSSGTAGSAIKMETTNANGDIWIDSGDDLIIDVAGLIDFDIVGEYELDVTAGITIASSEAATSAIIINASAGGLDIDANGDDMNITLTANNAGEDLTIKQDGAVDSQIIIDSVGTAIDSIYIREHSAGTAAGIKIHADAGTNAASIRLLSDLGGIDIDAYTGKDIAINAGQVLIEAEDDVTSAISLITNTGTTETIVIDNKQGNTTTSIDIKSTAGGITLTTGLATGILIKTGGYEHKSKYYAISAGVTSATEIIVVGGTGLTCVGLSAGVVEIGSTEGYVEYDDMADFIRFAITLPDDFVDTGLEADLIITFDIHEQHAGGGDTNCDIDILIYEYDGDANVGAILTDTIDVADTAARALNVLVTNGAGIGDEAELDAGDVLIFELTGTADTDDFNLYGMKLSYRVGLQATE